MGNIKSPIPTMQVMSHQVLTARKRFLAGTAIILICDHKMEPPKLHVNTRTCVGMTTVCFDDVEKGEPHCITRKNAETILAGVLCSSDIRHIIVSCPGGVSRSPAVAAAVLRKLGGDDTSIWMNGRYTPNETVFRTVAEVGDGFPVDFADLAAKQLANLKAWKKKNDLD